MATGSVAAPSQPFERHRQAVESRDAAERIDRRLDAYFAPWEQGESRLIANANANAGGTLQHRRAYQDLRQGGLSCGRLVKRWPNEELAGPGQVAGSALLAAA